MNQTIESVMGEIRRTNPGLAEKIKLQGYFVTDEDLPELVKINRLLLLLIRCGNGRFLCPAQDVSHFVAVIEEHYNNLPNSRERDYVRDVSLPV